MCSELSERLLKKPKFWKTRVIADNLSYKFIPKHSTKVYV